MNLRPYQQTALAGIHECLQTKQSTLLVLPTGCGKTVVFAHAVSRELANSTGRIMVIAHREELIRQAAAKIEAITGNVPDIEMAEAKADVHLYERARVVVSSVQTLCTGRVNRFKPEDFSLVITDEAHHATASSYSKVYDHLLSAGCKHIGVTATPDRSDEEALGQVFESVAFVYELPDAIHDGWLVPIRQRLVNVTGLDYSGVKTTAGDLNQGDVARAQSSERVLQEMCTPIVEVAAGRKTIVFATPGFNKEKNVEEFHIAEKMTDILDRHRPGLVKRVSQDTPKDQRRQMLADFRAGKFQILVNVGVLTEGYDEDSIRVVAITRPTKSRSLYSQMIGRGTRPLAGTVDPWNEPHERKEAIAATDKPWLEVLDFVGNSGKHKLVSVADILGGKYSDEAIAKAKEKAENGESVDMTEALDEAVHEIHEQKEREREARRKVIAQVQYTIKEIDPFNVFDIEPERERGWNKGRWASEKQVALLKRYGVDIPQDLTLGRAGQLIEECLRRSKSGQVNYRDAKKLREKGLPSDISSSEAAIALGQGDRMKAMNAKWQQRLART